MSPTPDRPATDAEEARADEPADPSAHPPEVSAKRKRRRAPIGQTIGGVLFGFEQQVWRTAPPPHELVHHARPDAPVPAADGSFVTITMPDGVDAAEDETEGEEP
jgi:hypothetical protein